MSVNIISLNQIINLFQSFSERNYFIKDFGYGPTSDIGTSRQMKFPYMWLSLDQNTTIVVQNKTAIPQYGITILFMDKMNIQKNYLDINGVNSDNSQEVLSDMLQLLQDLITEIEVEWGNYGLRIEGDVSCFPAVDETTDKVNGWVGQFSLRVKHSNCITPVGDIVQTNISPINPFTRYLTCDTLSLCPTIIDIQEELSNITGGTISGDYLSLSGGSVTGDTIFTEGLTGGTIYANTYENLPLGIYGTGLTFNTGNYELSIDGGDGILDTIDLSILASDLFVTGGTYNSNTGIATFTNNSGGTFSVSGFLTGYTDTYVTGGTLNGSVLTLNRQNGSFNINGFSTGYTLTTTEIVNTLGYTPLSAYTDNYVTGGTYSNGSLTLNRQNGSFTITGLSTGYTLTSSGIVTALGYTPISADTDNYVTGGTYSSGTLTLNRQNGSVSISGFPTGGGSSPLYGTFYDTTTQTNGGATTANSMTFNSTGFTNGVTIQNNSRMYVNTIGKYNIQFSAQIDKTDAGTDSIEIWLNKNGSPVDWSSTIITINFNDGRAVGSWNFFVDYTNLTDYYELKWHSIDTAMRLVSSGTQTNPTRPAIPSLILTINQIDI